MVLGSVSYTICAWKHYKKTERWPGLCAFCKSLCPSLLSSLQEVEIICTDNQPLSYNVWKVNDDNDEYVRMVLRKRDLFDGFRTAARNLLVTFILVGLHAQTPSGLTHDLREMVLQKPEFIWIIGAAVLILLLRYYHFTYLRYKYCYEDYKFQRERQKAPRESSNGCCNQVFIGIRRKDS